MNKLEPNAPCHCGSGRKYKRCCLKHDKTRRARNTKLGLWVGIGLGVVLTVITVASLGGGDGTPQAYQYDARNNKHWDPNHGHWHDGPAPASAIGSTPAPGETSPANTPAPWTYDANTHRHWNPDHGHWDTGFAPAGFDSEIPIGSIVEGIDPLAWEYDAETDRHWDPNQSQWIDGPPPSAP